MLNVNDVIQELYRLFIKGSSSNIHRVGVELELPIVNKDGDYTRECTLELIDFIKNNLGFDEVKPSATQFKHETESDCISFEYSSNTIEFSMEKSDSLLKIKKRFSEYYDALQDFLSTKNFTLLGSGLHPHWHVINTNPLPQCYYTMIKHHLAQGDRISRFHNHSDFCAYTCAVQTHLDINQDLPKLLNFYSFISAIKGFVFSNSVNLSQTNDFQNLACARDYLWWHSMFAYFPENIGYYKNINTTADIVNSMLERSMHYIYRNGMLYYTGCHKLSDYFSKNTINGYDLVTGRQITISPCLEDLQFFRSYKAIEITKRGTIEIRDDCMQPVYDAFAPSAFNLGISEMLPEACMLAKETARELGLNLYDFMPNRVLTTSLSAVDDMDKSQQDKWRRYCEQFFLLAKQGLCKRNKGEEILLDNVLERKNILENPAVMLYKKRLNPIELNNFRGK